MVGHDVGEIASVRLTVDGVAYGGGREKTPHLLHEVCPHLGPLVLDEFPYLAAQSPDLPSVLQKWIDREKRQAGILLALAGSSQRMMRSTILDASAPFYGRADRILKSSLLHLASCPTPSAWEELCREAIPRLAATGASLLPASRSWASGAPEWDAVSRSPDGGLLVLAECKSAAQGLDDRSLRRIIAAAEAKQQPSTRKRPKRVELWICAPVFSGARPRLPAHVRLISGRDVLGALSSGSSRIPS